MQHQLQRPLRDAGLSLDDDHPHVRRTFRSLLRRISQRAMLTCAFLIWRAIPVLASVREIVAHGARDYQLRARERRLLLLRPRGRYRGRNRLGHAHIFRRHRQDRHRAQHRQVPRQVRGVRHRDGRFVPRRGPARGRVVSRRGLEAREEGRSEAFGHDHGRDPDYEGEDARARDGVSGEGRRRKRRGVRGIRPGLHKKRKEALGGDSREARRRGQVTVKDSHVKVFLHFTTSRTSASPPPPTSPIPPTMASASSTLSELLPKHTRLKRIGGGKQFVAL